MKCPHCDYVDGWNAEEQKRVTGSEGNFYTLPIELKRATLSYTGNFDTVQLHGCPSCSKTFIDND